MNQLLRRQLSIRICVAIAIAVLTVSTASAAPRLVNARAGILIDRQSGEVLWEHNADIPLPPASTTKIVTAALALQSRDLDRIVSVSRKAAAEPPSNIRLRPGWSFSLDDLVYAILLNSANDASVVIAEGLSGSVPAFAARMNVLAYTLGARHSHFLNPNGLPADGHVSTARDLATIFDHALELPGFRDVLETSAKTIRSDGPERRTISLHTKNRLLTNYRYHVIGKTGWTRAAKKCFVGAATYNGREILVAMLGSDDLWGDLRRMVEFGFEGVPSRSPQLLLAAADPGDSAAAGDSDEVAPAPGGRYYVRVATFQRQAYAANLNREMRDDGFPAKVYRIVRNGRSLYRVSIGGYPNLRSASNVQRQVEKLRPRLKTLVVKS